jgi:anaerobic selenocysteine-containing dehydrogenase
VEDKTSRSSQFPGPGGGGRHHALGSDRLRGRVLPECTYLERYDELRNSGERQPSLALRMPAFEPLYESKPGWWIAKQLGHRLGLHAYFPWEDFSEKLDWQLRQVGSSLEEMQRIGVKNFPRKTAMYLSPGQPVALRTPSRKIELYSKQLAEAGFDPMPVYTPPDPAPCGLLPPQLRPHAGAHLRQDDQQPAAVMSWRRKTSCG